MGHLVTFAPLVGDEKVRDLLPELLAEVTDVGDVLPVRVLAGDADHLGLALALVVEPQHRDRLGHDAAARERRLRDRYAISGDLTGVYPSEIFPSELRASGIGLAAAASRVGAAVGTFLLPIGVANIGVGATVIIAAGVCAVGAVASHIWAPETTGLSLTKTGRFEAVGVDPAAASAH